MEDTESENKKTHSRSASYPSLNLEGAIAFTTKIYLSFSMQAVSREEVAVALKIHTNTVARPIAAAVQYGLMSKSTTDGYKVTTLFTDIYKPENPKQKKISLLTAFGSPKLFQELISKFDGHVIPEEFPNTLVKHHSITENAADDAATAFITSGQFAEAINPSKLLRYKDYVSALQKTQYAEVEEVETEYSNTNNAQEVKLITTPSVPTVPTVNTDEKRIPIYLTNDKVAYFAHPSNMTESDITLVRHTIDGILLRIKLEHEEKNKAPNGA